MKTESSLGIVHANKQKRIKSLAEHDDMLRVALAETCEQLQIPDGKAASIIDTGISRFIISSDGTVKPLSSYPDIESFVTAHISAAPSPRQSAIEVADERVMRKQELFDQLVMFSKAGDHKAYRAARSEYAAL